MHVFYLLFIMFGTRTDMLFLHLLWCHFWTSFFFAIKKPIQRVFLIKEKKRARERERENQLLMSPIKVLASARRQKNTESVTYLNFASNMPVSFAPNNVEMWRCLSHASSFSSLELSCPHTLCVQVFCHLFLTFEPLATLCTSVCQGCWIFNRSLLMLSY